ncbi:hypothetical protein WAA24_004324 [Stenotrophomonas maltophilia]
MSDDTQTPDDGRTWEERLFDGVTTWPKANPKKAAALAVLLVGLAALSWRYPVALLYTIWLRKQPVPALVFGALVGIVLWVAKGGA